MPYAFAVNVVLNVSNKSFFNPTDYIRQLQTKIPQEHAKAQQALKAGNRSEAQLCLTRRKLMENEVNVKWDKLSSVKRET